MNKTCIACLSIPVQKVCGIKGNNRHQIQQEQVLQFFHIRTISLFAYYKCQSFYDFKGRLDNLGKQIHWWFLMMHRFIQLRKAQGLGWCWRLSCWLVCSYSFLIFIVWRRKMNRICRSDLTVVSLFAWDLEIDLKLLNFSWVMLSTSYPKLLCKF